MPDRSLLGLKRMSEGIEDADAPFQKSVIVAVHGPKTVDDAFDDWCFGSTIFCVVHIEIVHDTSESAHSEAVQAEAIGEHLEGTETPLVTEVAGIHVERNVRLTRIVGERKRRRAVDETADEPRASHAIDTRSRPRHPSATLKGRGVQAL